MSVNRALPHVLVLPEDDANRQIANGFLLALDSSVQRRIQVLPRRADGRKFWKTSNQDLRQRWIDMGIVFWFF